jgi:hypothetical protein
MPKLFRKEGDNELKEMLRLANSYEMMRVHRFFDVDQLKRAAIKTDGMKFWKQAKKYHMQLHERISKYKRLTKIALLYRWLRNLALVFVTILLPIFLIYPRNPSSVPSFFLFFLSPLFLLAFIILLWFVVFLRWYVNQFMTSEKLKGMDAHLMKIVQHYIDQIVASIKKSDLNPNDFKFKLFTDKYKNVKVLKKPSFFRDFYVAIPNIEEKEGNGF